MKEYPLFKVHVGNVESATQRIRQVLESGFINEGEQVTQLTEAMSKKLDSQKLMMVNSCTSALTLALRLSGIKHGDNVVSTPMTCLATNCPIITAGARITWADIDASTGCIDVRDVERILTTTAARAVVAVAWAGIPPMLKDLLTVCQKHGAKLILDAAHAMKATLLSKPIHHWPDFTCYSLQAIKHITTGDGGILVCSESADLERAKRLKWFGIDRDHAKDEKGNWKGQHWDESVVEAGYKFNMNNLSAALGLEQIAHVDDVVAAHRINASTYGDCFAESRHVSPLRTTIGTSHWVYTVRLKNAGSGEKRDKVLAALNEEGIKAGVVHVRNDTYECFKEFKRELPNVDAFSASQFSLPVGWWLNEADIKHIARRTEAVCASVQGKS